MEKRYLILLTIFLLIFPFFSKGQVIPYEGFTVECIDANNNDCECLSETTFLNFDGLNASSADTFQLRISITSYLDISPGNELIVEGINSEFFSWENASVFSSSDYEYINSISIGFPSNSSIQNDTFIISIAEPYCDLKITTGIPSYYHPICELFKENVTIELDNYQCKEGIITFDFDVVNNALGLLIDKQILTESAEIKFIQANGNTFDSGLSSMGTFYLNECLLDPGSIIEIDYCTIVQFKGTSLNCCNTQAIMLPPCP